MLKEYKSHVKQALHYPSYLKLLTAQNELNYSNLILYTNYEQECYKFL